MALRPNANSPTEGSGYGRESVVGGRGGSRNFAGGIQTCAEDFGFVGGQDGDMSDGGVGICLIATVETG